jgi:hypothetical protein
MHSSEGGEGKPFPTPINHPFIDIKIHKILQMPFYRHLDGLCLGNDWFSGSSNSLKRQGFMRLPTSIYSRRGNSLTPKKFAVDIEMPTANY